MYQQNPNIAVWNSANEYIESAEILLDHNRLHSAVILAAIAVEVLLKTFLAKRVEPWRAETERGHSYVTLFKALSANDREDLSVYFNRQDYLLSLEDGLCQFSGLFVELRYPYERTAPHRYGSDVIYFARALCDAVCEIGRVRE